MDEELLEGNRKWVKEMGPEYFQRLGMPQQPRFLYIGCCDARVDPNSLLGMPTGRLFVHRNVGNQVNLEDMNILAAIEHAVINLKIKSILVVGHYDCGAINADRMTQPPHLQFWLSNIEILKRNEKDVRTLVEMNIAKQCENVKKLGYPGVDVYGFAFDPKDGVLKKIYMNEFSKYT